MTDPVNDKFEALSRLLEQDYVMVHLDTAAKDLEIPDYLRADPVVTLKLSYYFRGAIEVTKDLVTADLTFKGKSYICKIPLPAIWGMTAEHGEQIIWSDSMPANVLESLSHKGDDKPTKPKQRGHLRLVK